MNKNKMIKSSIVDGICLPMIIAELSGNHNQSLDRALQAVQAASECGVGAIKLQTFTADTITINAQTDDFLISDAGNLWQGKSLYKLYQEAHTPWEWHKAIFDHCKSLNLTCFSTPFDESAVDFLEELGCPFYKIASFENNHLPLLKKVAATGKPVIMSTGMANLNSLEEAVNTLRSNGCEDLILLKCTSTYPADPGDSNLKTIPHLRELFDCPVGLSDHTLGIGVALAAVALGAVVIEKHFTLSRADGGVDAAFSLEPAEMKQLVKESYRVRASQGEVRYGPTKNEEKSLKFRRSIYFTSDLQAGDVLTKDNVRIIRPGYGLEPRYYDLLLGKKITKSVKRGAPVSWDLVMESE